MSFAAGSVVSIGSLVDAADWDATLLGPRAAWSQSLLTSLSIITNSGFPMIVMWGPDLVLFYNAGYAPILGEKHPWAMGRPMREVWPEIWDTIGPMLDGVMKTGVATYKENLLLPLFRRGYLEECYFTFSYSPITDGSGVRGIFCAVAETSRKVIARRRLRTLHELEGRALAGANIDCVCRMAVGILARNPLDVPFSRIYLYDKNDRLRLVESSGPTPSACERWPLDEVAAGSTTSQVVPSTVEATLTLFKPSPVNDAIVLRITADGQEAATGVLVLGISPLSALDDDYRRFLERVAGQIAIAIKGARGYEEASSRAEALAQLNRAKTAFFNDISDQSRAPLLMLLGPIEHILRDAASHLDAKARGELLIAHRNSYRLLKLVNNLLDFARMETDRADASYEATDVAAVASKIANGLRSAIEYAGLELRIDAPAPVTAYVDPKMWERIGLNLLSNAVKFTFAGNIAVRVWSDWNNAHLCISDTGAGIPAEELPGVFERFRRVRSVRSRTHEGTGIGLALVHELVGLHGGSIDVKSSVGAGTSFTVTVPLGKAHSGSENPVGARAGTAPFERIAQYLEEIAGWLQSSGEDSTGAFGGETILVVDDKEDLRSYLRRILSPRWNVMVASDGAGALRRIAERKPDLVIGDMMMSDGIGLLAHLRADPATERLPVILLSARAGEAGSSEGWRHGADDYLVKPFTEDRLLARVEAGLNSARTREQATLMAERARDSAMENERVLRLLADAVPQIICTGGPDGKIVYFNRRWFEFTGYSEAQTFENYGWLQTIHPDDRDAVESGWRGAGETGSDFSVEARIRSHTGDYCWFLQRAAALRADDGSVVRFFATATDIDDRKCMEEREKFLFHVTEVLSSTLEAREVLQKITELCVPTFADWCQVQSFSADEELIVEAVRHTDPQRNKRLEELVGRSVVAVRDASFGSPQVLRQARSHVLDHKAALRAVRANVPDPENRQIYEEAGIGTALIVPLVARGRMRGTLHLVNVDPNSHRPEKTLKIAEELGRRVALAMDNSRLYEREHRVAATLQRAMLPAHLPSHPRIELSYAYRPAERESRVGGDWYDAFVISEGQMAISIGDVSGHGLEASVAMNEARQALRLSALEGLSPAQTLRRANAALMLNEDHPLITAIYGLIDVERSLFRYSCAGHPPPAAAQLTGKARYLAGGGIPMGIYADAEFPTNEVELEPFATLLLYTDGLIEFDRNLERETARLLDALSERVHDMSSDGAGMLLRHVLNGRQLDDIAVLAVTILPAHPQPVELKLPAAPLSATIVRRFVSRYARVAQLGPERSFDLLLAVGEAVANAVEHAYRGATGDFVLRMAWQDDDVLGEVQDRGTWRENAPSAERGRGLSILRATTRRFELNRSPHGTTVSFAI